MPTKFYRKDIPEMPVYIFGKPLKFEILETADPALIEELDKCIQFGRGGVIAMTAEQFEEEAKKKPSGTSSESVYKQKRQRLELSSPLSMHDLAAEGANDVRISSAFAQPQEREATPHTRFGLPSGTGPAPGSGSKPMPDPIEVPKAEEMKPPTAKLSEVAAVR